MNIDPSVSIDDVVINSELLRRTARPPDYEAENIALVRLARTLADSPDQILQRIVETALSLPASLPATVVAFIFHDQNSLGGKQSPA